MPQRKFIYPLILHPPMTILKLETLHLIVEILSVLDHRMIQVTFLFNYDFVFIFLFIFVVTLLFIFVFMLYSYLFRSLSSCFTSYLFSYFIPIFICFRDCNIYVGLYSHFFLFICIYIYMGVIMYECLCNN